MIPLGDGRSVEVRPAGDAATLRIRAEGDRQMQIEVRFEASGPVLRVQAPQLQVEVAAEKASGDASVLEELLRH